MARQITWVETDHVHQYCGGRIYRAVSGQGPSPGGNPLFKCGFCSKATTAMGPEALCWCETRTGSRTMTPYRCVPANLASLRNIPEKAEAIKRAFASVGYDFTQGSREIGVMLEADYRKIMESP